jgi:hypothetical protein
MIIDIIKNNKIYHFKNRFKALFWLICFDSINNTMWLIENWNANKIKISYIKKTSIKKGEVKEKWQVKKWQK